MQPARHRGHGHGQSVLSGTDHDRARPAYVRAPGRYDISIF